MVIYFCISFLWYFSLQLFALLLLTSISSAKGTLHFYSNLFIILLHYKNTQLEYFMLYSITLQVVVEEVPRSLVVVMVEDVYSNITFKYSSTLQVEYST